MMQRITYTNSVNGLSCTFSNDTPLMFLESIDGCSCGAQDIVVKPLAFDGQRFLSSSLNARTVQFTAQFGGIADGRYSRVEAMKRWQEIQRVFIPGNMGVLTWTDGTNSRFIECRTAEMPNYSQMLPFLFRVSFSLTADYPYWQDSVENVVSFSAATVSSIVTNDCGIAVPFIIEATPSADIMLIYNRTTDKRIAFSNTISDTIYIDTRECTVKTASGDYCNHLLTVDSEFFKLIPGDNDIAWLGVPTAATLKWRKAYMAIG
ncbi:MAG: hypothetical protein E7478_09145 [Ruminococcaceae bacterium]|nr:hypothetical protein [Oscillospiraceae bacterium]